MSNDCLRKGEFKRKDRTLMKKIVCLILTVCSIFLVSCGTWPKSVVSEENAVLTWDLYGVSELSSKLESEKVDIDDASAYEIGVLIELVDVSLDEGFDFDTRNISNLKYKWFKMNHFMRDSSLEFFYTDSNETDRVYSYEIFKFLAYVKKYSGYDISGVRDEFIKQCNWLAENEPNCAPNIDNFGDWFDNKLKEYEE
jgi:hypothetical protein